MDLRDFRTRVGEHHEECLEPDLTTGLMAYSGKLVNLMDSNVLTKIFMLFFSPFFFCQILMCRRCGSIFVINQFSQLIVETIAMFTAHEGRRGSWVTDKVMYVDNLKDKHMQRLKNIGVISHDYESEEV